MNFKRLFSLFIVMFFLGSPLFVLADCGSYTTKNECKEDDTCIWDSSSSNPKCIAAPVVDLNDCDNDAVCGAINKIKGYVEMVGTVVIGMMIIIAGFLYATGGGNEKQLSTAKSMITAAVIGMIILLSADIITTTVKALLGFGG